MFYNHGRKALGSLIDSIKVYYRGSTSISLINKVIIIAPGTKFLGETVMQNDFLDLTIVLQRDYEICQKKLLVQKIV